SIRIGAESVTLSDSLGGVISTFSQLTDNNETSLIVTVERMMNRPDGRPLGRLRLESNNVAGSHLTRLSMWDAIFRVLGLIASLIVSALFLKAVLLPYRRIKREALDFNLDIGEPEQGPGIEYTVSTFKNLITELEEKRDRLENLYRNSELRADSLARYNEYILGSINSGVIICDSDGIVTRFNPSAQNTLQYLEKDCRGKHYRDIFGGEHKLVSIFDDALLHNKVYSRLEFETQKVDGGRLWLGCSSSLINDESGGGMGVVLLLIDLTEIRRLQERNSYSDKMVALGETAAGLAHEVRNSFAAIIGFADLLGKLTKHDEQLGKLIAAIKEESSLAEGLMSRFLSFARPLYLNPEQIDIRDVIESAIASCNPHQAGIRISTQLMHEIPRIVGDPTLLRQAVSNLMINACEAVGSEGEIRVRARLEREDRDPIRSVVVIDVIDNGMGIEPEIESRIFEPFVSGKPHGTGLGLALVKKIVVLHGGRIEVHSKSGKGTRFTIFLPIDLIEYHLSERSTV
ncbi:MAG: hypothetical protein A2W25_00005, partial [candidate division Zixibacteria bacterium RBG_16_53_22]